MNNKRKYNRKQLGWGGAGSGAVSGASTGAMFGPWGAVIGGAVGGVAGHFSEEQQKESEGQDNSIGQAASITQGAIGIAGSLKGRGNVPQQGVQSSNPPIIQQPLVSQQVGMNPNNSNPQLVTPTQFAMGGNTQLSEINNGGTHEQNPNGGVPMGQTASVEQGETKWEDYIFSDRIKVPGAKHTFADESKKIQKKYPKEMENDVPTQSAKRREMERLMKAQEALRTEMGLNDESQVAAYGGRMKFPDGGSLNANKTDTIFTNDPKDPRIKMYTDSLNLHKGYIFQKNNILPDIKQAEWRKENGYPERKVGEKSKLKSTFKPTPTALDKKNQLLKEWSQLLEKGAYTEAKEFEKKNPGLSDDAGVRNVEELKKYLGKTKSDQSSIKVAEYYKKLGFPDGLINFYGSPDLYHPKIKPTGEYFDGIANSPIYKKPVQPVAYKTPESKVETTTDSKGRTVYPNDKVSDKAKKYFAENPSMFNAIGAPKMETTIDTNKDAIMKSLNNSKTVSKTPSSIPAPALKWLDEPGVTGWQQAYDPSKKKTAYRPVTKGVDGKPKYGPIEYKMGGSLDLIPEVDNSGIRLQDILTPSDLSSLSQLGSQLRHDPLYPSIRDREIGLPTKIPLEEPLRGSIMRSSNQGMTSFSPKRAYGGRIKMNDGGNFNDSGYSDKTGSYDAFGNMIAAPYGEIENRSQLTNSLNYVDAWNVDKPWGTKTPEQSQYEEQVWESANKNLETNPNVVPETITSKFAPEGNGVLARPLNNNSNLGIMNPSIGASAVTADTFNPLAGMNNGKAAGQGVLQNPPQPTNLESGYTTNTGLGNTKQKGTSGFDKYDAITMGAQLLPAMYNIGQGLRKQKPVDLGRMTPNLVNYDSSRKASEDSFNQQANILNEGIRENATSSGQALSNRVAFANRAALDKANQLGQSNEREYNTNQQIRGNADQVNLQIRANEEMIDAQNKGISQTSVGMGLAQIGQAAGTINRDRNLRLGERETIGMMGEGLDFEYEPIPGTNRFRRIRKGAKPTTTTEPKITT